MKAMVQLCNYGLMTSFKVLMLFFYIYLKGDGLPVKSRTAHNSFLISQRPQHVVCVIQTHVVANSALHKMSFDIRVDGKERVLLFWCFSFGDEKNRQSLMALMRPRAIVAVRPSEVNSRQTVCAVNNITATHHLTATSLPDETVQSCLLGPLAAAKALILDQISELTEFEACKHV